MFSYYLKSALRSIFRNKVTSAISILGLGIGLGCIMILMALVFHERSFDKFIPDNKNVYRILFGSSAQISYPVAENMSQEFPEVKQYFRYYQANYIQVKTNDNEIIGESNFGFADPSIFKITGIKFISGSPASSPSEVAISQESAMKYFGNPAPIGSMLPVKFYDGISSLTISGVYKDFPPNSTLHPAMVADLQLSEKMLRQFQTSLGDFGSQNSRTLDWTNGNFHSYVVLDKNADPAELSKKMGKYIEFFNKANKDNHEFRLQPVTEIYLGSRGIEGNYILRQGNPDDLKYYEIVSILILIIAVSNFILLTRAGVAERISELGTRKAFGASLGMIRRLIIIESNIVVILSLIPASFIIDYGINFINSTLNKTLSSQAFLNPLLWILIILVVIFTGTLAGWLIGLYYSKIPALNLINGNIIKQDRSIKWNYSFLVLHFTIYMILVTGVLAVTKQKRYSFTNYRGLNLENIITTSLSNNELRKSYSAICDEMEKVPEVLKASGGTYIPPLSYSVPVNLATTDGGNIRLDGLIFGQGMTELLNMEIIDGESFGAYKAGTIEVLINESSAKKYNVKAGESLLAFNVRGILKDFNARSLHELIEPMVVLQQNPAKMSIIAVKTTGKNDAAVIKRLRELFSQIAPDEIFEARYLTDYLEELYTRERNQARIIGVFALLATILSIMGLFGISLISISKRKKEIGLRKVSGASISEVLLLVNTDFLKWVIISVVISVPVSVYLLNQWMNRFAYKTTLSWWLFAAAGLSAVIIAILTVSWQSWRAATGNPVKALRYE